MNNDATAAESMDLSRCMFEGAESAPEEFVLRYTYPSVKDGTPVFLEDTKVSHFNEVDGRAIFEGDIVVGSADHARTAKPAEGKGLVITGDEFRWPQPEIKFVIADESLRSKVRLAAAHWEAHTPFRFKEVTLAEVTGGTDYISFDDQGGCFSNVGRQGGEQTISLGAGCGLGAAIHEIGHALGLWHEQGRSDRDKFVKIHMDRVKPNARHNFNKHVDDGDDVAGYDFGSIMHYPEWAFQIDERPTIETLNGESIGQRNGLSGGDIEAIRAIYPHFDWAGVQDTFNGGSCSCGHM